MAQWVKIPTAAALVTAEACIQSPTLYSGLKDLELLQLAVYVTVVAQLGISI